MKIKLFALLSALALAIPAQATPVAIVNPNEEMITVPGLEFVGPSRASTVTFCANDVGVDHYRDLQTDSEFEGMQACLDDLT
jgi:hypothetical protein